MSTTPPLNGQVIGRAHYATRAAFERLLAPSGTTFPQSVALNAVAGGAVDREQVIGRLTDGLKIDHAAAEAVVAELIDARLLAAPAGDRADLELTAAGEELNRTVRAAADELTARLYGDLPAEDLAAAARVLTAVTARANAELAALPH
ncbi:hypothetical protein GCM10010441_19110 [Kitasatospora paracochleata]|uniref:DNA-binding MarR family transcriptional regulator n=1 Tax=Kitasatospora paracochleata TaxID=58354 RepID=A0ABT1J3F0_9ACTN|nr:hypothetical protein [Kitasatospora paracochleata]MCP2311952.1 DNA-binding MarR family transcriptional regulator [Kitasatospora paracochleata]